ncbi:LytR/AlgR family response regulator transcription factor [Aquimarina pacifica]|uniref:LytR/AlgR family response regulator transcription factor n=1 Tax=Aquimarina pacifica TaxID=1296415 RepID=UPI000470BF4F|nr:response regulator [Aquimarina pacifica]
MNKKLTAILVDDEPLAIETLGVLLDMYCPEIEIVGKGNSIDQAIILVETYKPQIVFLDIEMPNGNGFMLLNRIDTTNIKIIFTTAYSQYTIQAIRKGVHDYLMKPIDSDELVSSIDRLKKSLLEKNPHEEKVLIQCMDKVHRIKLNQIQRCESESNYTHLFLNSDKKITVSMTLKSIEQKLIHDTSFIRVHQSHLINKDYVVSLSRGAKPGLTMKSGEEIPISYRKKTQVFSKINC